jgi:RNA polymerase sigma-70 factor (ECF subfamily)
LRLDVVHRWDDASLEMLYRHFYKALVAFSTRMVGGVKAAEEIVQDTFVRTWQKRNTFQSTGTLKAYLFNSVRNGSISHLRHAKVERGRIEAIEREFTEIQTDESGELQLHREEVYRQLLSAIEQLPAKQRELFLLSVQGKTSAEIAAEMGITPESVKKQRQRGLARLRELLPPEAFLLLLFLLE